MTIGLSLYDSKLFEEHLRNKKGLMESSIRTYVGVINQFLVESDNVEDLEQYNAFLVKYAIKKRCAYYYIVLRSFIEWRIEDEVKKNYLLENLVKPQYRTDFKFERKYLPEEKIIEVINNLKQQKHRIIALMQTLTGARAGDIIRLKRGNILVEEYEGKPVVRITVIGKGNKRNVVFIHDEVAQKIILNYMANATNIVKDFLFFEQGKMRNRPGNLDNEFTFYKMNYMHYWADLKQALQSAKVNRREFSTHDFRRCFARRVWERYKDIHVLQGLLNHVRPDTTLRYLAQSGLKNIDYFKEMQNG